jgi:hypothetical protein
MERKNTDILTCWKEIALYLDRSIRTCQRWVITKNLPVHYPGGRSSSPYASARELNEWMLSGRHGLEGGTAHATAAPAERL